MKRITLLAMTLGLCLVLVAPAMALDLDFSGEYRTRGYYIDKADMGQINGNEIDKSYMDMRFRLQTIFKVNENISVTTRFDALDNKVWGDKFPAYKSSNALWNGTSTAPAYTYDNTPDSQANVDFDRAYATIKTPIGGFLFGRMKDSSWGTSFGDSEGDGDRLVYVVPIKNWIFAAVYEKWHEVDSDPNNQGEGYAPYAPTYGSSQDNDKFYLSGTYRSETFTAGLLYGYYSVNSFLDVGDETLYQKLGTLTTLGGTYATADAMSRRPITATAHILSPYIVGKWGDFDLQLEGTYALGKIKAMPNGTTDSAIALTGIKELNAPDRDLETWQYMIDATYHLGPVALNGGWAHQCGGVKYRRNADGKATGFGIIEPGGDWNKLWILTGGSSVGDDNGMYRTMAGAYTPYPAGTGITTEGNLGNEANPYSQTSINGYQIFYFGVDYAFMENMAIGGLVGFAKADKVIEQDTAAYNPQKWEKDQGVEYDVNFIWDIYENLRWQMTYAYLKAGDYWKQGNPNTQLKDPYTFYTKISVNF